MNVYFRAKDGNSFAKNPSRKVRVKIDRDDYYNYKETEDPNGFKETFISGFRTYDYAYEYQFYVDEEWAIDGDNTYTEEYIKEKWPEVWELKEKQKYENYMNKFSFISNPSEYFKKYLKENWTGTWAFVENIKKIFNRESNQ